MTTIGDLAKRPSTTAGRDYVREIATDLNLDIDTASRVADYILNTIEEEAAERAMAVMLLTPGGDTVGPVCSWCHTLGGLCWHVKRGGILREQHILALHKAGALRRAAAGEWHGPAGELDPWLQGAADELRNSGHIPAQPGRPAVAA